MEKMSALDASFLDVEDAVSHMHIGSIGIFQGPPPPHEELRSMVLAKLPLVPRYRQVARAIPLSIGRPHWVDDQHFNLDYHLRRTGLPAPGGEGELRSLVGRVMSQQLDRSKPLWEMWAVKGLEDGRWCHLEDRSLHGRRCCRNRPDIHPDGLRADHGPAPQRGVDAARSAWNHCSSHRGNHRKSPHPSPRSQGPVLTRGSPSARTGSAAGAGADARRCPAHSAILVERAARAKSPLELRPCSVVGDQGGPCSPWRDGERRRAHGDHRRIQGAEPLAWRAGRTARARAGPGVRALKVRAGVHDNRVSAMFAELPVALDDPVERLHAISAQMADLKQSHEAVAAEVLTSLSGFAAPLLLALGERLATRIPQHNINTVTTNVPGPQQPLYACGRRMLESLPYVPLGGHVRVGVAIFSYNGACTFGVTGDYDAAPDIHVLCHGIERSMAELLICARTGLSSAARS